MLKKYKYIVSSRNLKSKQKGKYKENKYEWTNKYSQGLYIHGLNIWDRLSRVEHTKRGLIELYKGKYFCNCVIIGIRVLLFLFAFF